MQQAHSPTVLLAGNPNVGKSTIFNYLTGLHQHTGNWTGKTVSGATGICKQKESSINIIDTPGTYSLLPYSPEETVTFDILSQNNTTPVLVVCDATAPQRGLAFLLEIVELCPRVILCFNLADQAKKKGIQLDLSAISKTFGIPVITTSSKDKKSYRSIKNLLFRPLENHRFQMEYPLPVEEEIACLIGQIRNQNQTHIPHRFLAIKLLEQDRNFINRLQRDNPDIFRNVDMENTFRILEMKGYTKERLERLFTLCKQQKAIKLCAQTVTQTKPPSKYMADRILTHPLGGTFLFCLLLFLVFWITIYAAQAPSALLQNLLFSMETPLSDLLTRFHLPVHVVTLLTQGVYRVVAFVISVMLPPMAIFFPLFTLLEDLGLLPRIAFNLDHRFAKCKACGKQSLTMCMGFGCNATGVMGCRIIHSPRERLIAIITNSLVPCNGRFPTLITLLTVIGSFTVFGNIGSFGIALALTGLITLTIVATLFVSNILSKTLLKGKPSFYALELPSFRVPKIGQILIRSVLDRTLFVLGRAVAVAAPAGLILWLFANINIGGAPFFTQLTSLLQPIGNFFGVDGIILLAFLLGLPANEIILPIMIMLYLGNSTLTATLSLPLIKEVLIANNWTMETALCVLFLMLFHSPCSTTLITIYKETRSKGYTLLAFAIPATIGLLGCLFIHALFSLM